MQKRNFNRIKIFIDFDGTICPKDVANDFFKTYLGSDTFHKNYTELKSKEISIKEYWNKSLQELQNTNLTSVLNHSKNDHLNPSDVIINNYLVVKEMYYFLHNIEVDPYFIKFLLIIDKINLLHNKPAYTSSKFNSKQDQYISAEVVSDGFDFYIDPILKLNAIKVPYQSNTTKVINGKLSAVFNLESESCQCQSASCKQSAVLKDTQEDDLLIYIGDGASDFAAASICDIVFAKADLSRYCNQNNIPHHNFHNFFDILIVIEKMFIDKSIPIKIRNNAFLRRKLIFEIE